MKKTDNSNITVPQTLLSERDSDGRIPYHPYKKWYGGHWVLSQLADIEYPKGEASFTPLKRTSI